MQTAIRISAHLLVGRTTDPDAIGPARSGCRAKIEPIGTYACSARNFVRHVIQRGDRNGSSVMTVVLPPR